MSARVLVVDDEEIMTAMISALLDVAGHEVRQASDGVGACHAMADYTPDVIVSDLAMPRMDGFELLRKVRQDPHLRDIPVIILTAHGEVENRIQAFQLGADGFLVKPFSTSLLVDKVNELAAGRSGPRSAGDDRRRPPE